MGRRPRIDRDPLDARLALVRLGYSHGQNPIAEFGLNPLFIDVTEREAALKAAVNLLAESAAAVFGLCPQLARWIAPMRQVRSGVILAGWARAKNRRSSAAAEHVPALIPPFRRSDAAPVGLAHVLALPDQIEQRALLLVRGDGGLVWVVVRTGASCERRRTIPASRRARTPLSLLVRKVNFAGGARGAHPAAPPAARIRWREKNCEAWRSAASPVSEHRPVRNASLIDLRRDFQVRESWLFGRGPAVVQMQVVAKPLAMRAPHEAL